MIKKIHTFIFVHDQKIILDYTNNKKFNELGDVTYVFVGTKDSSQIEKMNNVIICNKLKYNIEDYPKLTSFTGWYALWKNNLYQNYEYLNLFEYDINLSQNFLENLNSNLNCDVIGYIPYSVHATNFLKVPKWSTELINSVSKNYKINSSAFIDSLPKEKMCSVTSNHTFSLKSFEGYMKWMEPMIDDIKNSTLSGHQVERSISLFYLIKNLNYKLLPNTLTHFQLDSHKTQWLNVDKFNSNYNKLL